MAQDPGLETLLAMLRHEGIHVGIREQLVLRRLFGKHLEQAPLDKQGLRDILAAVLIKSRAQIDPFEHTFEQWWEKVAIEPPEQDDAEPAPQERHPRPFDHEPPTPLWWRLLGAVALALALTGMAIPVVSGILEEIERPSKEAQQAAQSQANQTLAAAQRLSTPPDTGRAISRASLVVESARRGAEPGVLPEDFVTWVPVVEVQQRPDLAFAAWWLVALLAFLTMGGIWWRFRLEDWLGEAIRPADKAGLSRIVMPPSSPGGPQLLDWHAQIAIIEGLGSYVSDWTTHRLDIDQTVSLSAESAGIPTLVFERSRHPVELWQWFDELIEDPDIHRLCEEVAHTLRKVRLPAHEALFLGTPQTLHREGEEYTPAELVEHRRAVVLVYTDGHVLTARAHKPRTHQAIDVLLRELAGWSDLVFVDPSRDAHNLSSLLAGYGIEAIAPEQVAAHIGGLKRLESWPQVDTDGALYGDDRIWQAACALSPRPIDEDTALWLRARLDLAASPWGSGRLSGRSGTKLTWSRQARARALNWLQTVEGADGGLFWRALGLWLERYAEEDTRRKGMQPQPQWEDTPAEHQLRMERLLLELWYTAPERIEATTKGLHSLFRAGLAHKITSELKHMAAQDQRVLPDEGLHLPWALSDQGEPVQVMLLEMGLGSAWSEARLMSLHRPGRLWLALALCFGLGLSALAAAYALPQRDHPEFNHIPASNETIAEEWRVPGSQTALLLKTPHGVWPRRAPRLSSLEVRWRKERRPCRDVLAPGAEIWRCPPQVVGETPSGETKRTTTGRHRMLAVLAASPTDPYARRLALDFLQTGSAHTILIARDWSPHLEALTGPLTATIKGEQLVIMTLDEGTIPSRVEDFLANSPDNGVVVAGRPPQDTFAFAGVKTVGEVWGELKVIAGNTTRTRLVGLIPRGDMVKVPAGSFIRGTEGRGDESPQKEVWLEEFWIDRFEVRVGQYRKCVEEGKCSAPSTTSRSCSGRFLKWNNWDKEGREEHPVNCVDWSQAMAYCQWANKRLPTEAEWEKAARGTKGQKYPWGDETPSCKFAVMDDGSGKGCGEDRTWVVGSKPAGTSPFGAYDMAGNVWEWVEDVYDADYYARAPDRNPVNRDPKSGSVRVFRGGSFVSDAGGLRAADRVHFTPGFADYGIGFRCAR